MIYFLLCFVYSNSCTLMKGTSFWNTGGWLDYGQKVNLKIARLIFSFSFSVWIELLVLHCFCCFPTLTFALFQIVSRFAFLDTYIIYTMYLDRISRCIKPKQLTICNGVSTIYDTYVTMLRLKLRRFCSQQAALICVAFHESHRSKVESD